jgi:hypothetical protein
VHEQDRALRLLELRERLSAPSSDHRDSSIPQLAKFTWTGLSGAVDSFFAAFARRACAFSGHRDMARACFASLLSSFSQTKAKTKGRKEFFPFFFCKKSIDSLFLLLFI